MRVTKKYLANWVNERLKEKRMRFTVVDIYPTRYRNHEYENGAYKTIVSCGSFYVYSGYSLAEMQKYINEGEDIYLQTDTRIGDWTIEVTIKGRMSGIAQKDKQITGGLAGWVDRAAAEVDAKEKSLRPASGRQDPGIKATEMLVDYLEELDAYTGGRQRHTAHLVRRLLNRALTEIINATRVSDPETAAYYGEVKTCLSTKTIK